MNKRERKEISGHALRERLEMPTLNGQQRLEYAEKHLSPEQLMYYKGLKPASRITVPLCNFQHIRDAIQVLRMTATELDNLIKGRTFMMKTDDKEADRFRKIVMAQLIVRGAGTELKRRASPNGLGFPDGAFMGVK